MFFQDCKLAHQAQITGISHSVKEILPPDLLDLTQLQKEANIRYGFTASEVYDIAQSLYEKKLISYPRTSSRYLTEDVLDSLSPIMRVCYHGSCSLPLKELEVLTYPVCPAT